MSTNSRLYISPDGLRINEGVQRNFNTFGNLQGLPRTQETILRAKESLKQDLIVFKTLISPLSFAYHARKINHNLKMILDETISEAWKRKEMGIGDSYESMYNADVASMTFQKSASSILLPSPSSINNNARVSAFVRPQQPPSLISQPSFAERSFVPQHSSVREVQAYNQNKTSNTSHHRFNGFFNLGPTHASYGQSTPSFSGLSTFPCGSHQRFLENNPKLFKAVVKIGPIPDKYKIDANRIVQEIQSFSDDAQVLKKSRQGSSSSDLETENNERFKKHLNKKSSDSNTKLKKNIQRNVKKPKIDVSTESDSSSYSESSNKSNRKAYRDTEKIKRTKRKAKKTQKYASTESDSSTSSSESECPIRKKEKESKKQVGKGRRKPKSSHLRPVKPNKIKKIIITKSAKNYTTEPKPKELSENEIYNWSIELQNKKITIVGNVAGNLDEAKNVSLVVSKRCMDGRILAQNGCFYILKGPMQTNMLPKEIAKRCSNGSFPLKWRKIQTEWNNLRNGENSSKPAHRQTKPQNDYDDSSGRKAPNLFEDLGIDLDKLSGCMTPTSLLTSIKKPIMNERCTPPIDNIEDFLLQPTSTTSYTGSFYISPGKLKKNGLLKKRVAKAVTEAPPRKKPKKNQIKETKDSPENKEEVETIMEALKAKGQTPPLVKQVFRGEIIKSDDDDDDVNSNEEEGESEEKEKAESEQEKENTESKQEEETDEEEKRDKPKSSLSSD